MEDETPKHKTAKEVLDDFVVYVDTYSQKRGLLPPNNQAVRVEKYLEMTPDDFDELDEEGISKIAIDVAGYVGKLTNALNEQICRANKAKLHMELIIEPILENYDAYKTEDKRMMAIFDNDAAEVYYKAIKNSQAFVSRWDGYAQCLENFIKQLEHLGYAKKRR